MTLDRIRASLAKLKDKFSSRPAAMLVLPCGRAVADFDCTDLARQDLELQKAQDNAALASAVYKKPADRDEDQPGLPEGTRRATTEQLKALGLIDKRGNDLTVLDKHDRFKCDVYVRKDGSYVVAFKGTTFYSPDDWAANIAQGTGMPSAYYSRALAIGKQLKTASQPVEFVGHSLGGGLASAAATAADKQATTFNAAGLLDKTLVRDGLAPISPSKIKAYYVRGDILSTIQDYTKAKNAAGDRYALPPPNDLLDMGAAVVGAIAGPKTALAARAVALHMMSSVDGSLQKSRNAIAALKRQKGCP